MTSQSFGKPLGARQLEFQPRCSVFIGPYLHSSLDWVLPLCYSQVFPQDGVGDSTVSWSQGVSSHCVAWGRSQLGFSLLVRGTKTFVALLASLYLVV